MSLLAVSLSNPVVLKVRGIAPLGQRKTTQTGAKMLDN